LFDGASYTPHAIAAVVQKVEERGDRVDFLLTNDWPKGCSADAPDGVSSPGVRELVKTIAPRYAVFGRGTFFKCGPFEVAGPAVEETGGETAAEQAAAAAPRRVRLVGVAPVGAGKWAHALSIEPDGDDGGGDLEPNPWAPKPEEKPKFIIANPEASEEDQSQWMKRFGINPLAEHAKLTQEEERKKAQAQAAEIRRAAKEEKQNKARLEKRAAGQFAERIGKMLKKTPGVFD
jgi:hypothetical protein